MVISLCHLKATNGLNKSDISYLFKNQPGLRRCDPLRQAKLCWLVRDCVGTMGI